MIFGGLFRRLFRRTAAAPASSPQPQIPRDAMAAIRQIREEMEQELERRRALGLEPVRRRGRRRK